MPFAINLKTEFSTTDTALHQEERKAGDNVAQFSEDDK
jgi:hypothetical protein